MLVNSPHPTVAVKASRVPLLRLLATTLAIGSFAAPAYPQSSGPTVGYPCSKLGATAMAADQTDILACVYAPAPTTLWERYGGTAPSVIVENDCNASLVTSCTATCPAGAHVTGGGCTVISAPFFSFETTAPSSNTSWLCSTGPLPTAASRIIAYAVCSDPGH
jgi:hypothetical protein